MPQARLASEHWQQTLISCKLQLSCRCLQIHGYDKVGKGALAMNASALDNVSVKATSIWSSQYGQTLIGRWVQMYKYGGVDTGADALTSFAKEGYKGTAALDVPKEISPVEVALKQLKANSSMVLQPLMTAGCHLLSELLCSAKWLVVLMMCCAKLFELIMTCRLLGLRLAFSLQQQRCCYGSKARLRQQAERRKLKR